MFDWLLCKLGFHQFPDHPDRVEGRDSCIQTHVYLCKRGCGAQSTTTVINHHFDQDDVCTVCGLNRDYVPRRGRRLTSDIENDPDADYHDWLGSDINLRR